MAMFMYVCRNFIYLLFLSVLCEVTPEQTTLGPHRKFCSTTSYEALPIPPLAKEDEDVINAFIALLGCSMGVSLPESCSVGSSAVTCSCYAEDNKICRVVKIDFSNRGLEGMIPEKIGDLRYLETLYLNGNKLRGSIPESFQNLKSLSEFNLCDNSLEGPIPPFIGQMTSLKNIYLCKNFFNETIPKQLGSLPSLQYLDLGNNFLSGKIPDELGNIKSLIGLYLSDNQLSEVLPSQLGNLVNLEQLYLQSNEFIGPLPPSFKGLNKLTYFNVQGNNLNETIPDIFGSWKTLNIMHISDLVGERSSFPDLSGMKFLRVLTLRNCSIADKIPVGIWNLSGLQYL